VSGASPDLVSGQARTDGVASDGSRRRTRGPARAVRLLAVTTVGGLLLVAGLAALVLPGPGLLLCLLGLVVLSSEYAWAQRSLDWARKASRRSVERGAASRRSTYTSLAGGAGLLAVGVAELVWGLPWIGAVSAVLLMASGVVATATTAAARGRHLRAVPERRTTDGS
jgi:fatty acid desaturase